METENETDNTTENETESTEQKARTVDQLLQLNTYQGMTDKEIESIIEYKVMLAHMDVESMAYRTAAQENMEAILEANENSCATARNVLESILAESDTEYELPELKTLNDDDLTDTFTE